MLAGLSRNPNSGPSHSPGSCGRRRLGQRHSKMHCRCSASADGEAEEDDGGNRSGEKLAHGHTSCHWGGLPTPYSSSYTAKHRPRDCGGRGEFRWRRLSGIRRSVGRRCDDASALQILTEPLEDGAQHPVCVPYIVPERVLLGSVSGQFGGTSGLIRSGHRPVDDIESEIYGVDMRRQGLFQLGDVAVLRGPFDPFPVSLHEFLPPTLAWLSSGLEDGLLVDEILQVFQHDL